MGSSVLADIRAAVEWFVFGKLRAIRVAALFETIVAGSSYTLCVGAFRADAVLDNDVTFGSLALLDIRAI
jgi:hypothetical protein